MGGGWGGDRSGVGGGGGRCGESGKSQQSSLNTCFLMSRHTAVTRTIQDELF